MGRLAKALRLPGGARSAGRAMAATPSGKGIPGIALSVNAANSYPRALRFPAEKIAGIRRRHGY